MPYLNERATGDSLWRLEENPSVQAFKGSVRVRSDQMTYSLPPTIKPARRQNPIRRIIAVDGSTITKAVQNGFPRAEAALFNAAVIVIKVDELAEFDRDRIPSPSQLRDLEKVETMSAVLPGQNVVGLQPNEDTPKKFYRHTVRQELDFRLDESHESLLETYHTITASVTGSGQTFQCPIDECEMEPPGSANTPRVARQTKDTFCPCPLKEQLYSTDSLRTHERFHDFSSSEQAFTAFRMVTEHLLMTNILRYFHKNLPVRYFDDTAFVIDGPLAIFGMPAWLKEHIQTEVARIHNDLVSHDRLGLLLIGLEKTGEFIDHLEEIDWDDSAGQRQRLPDETVLVPTTEYIYKHITPNPNSTKPYGQAVYYGRKIMYKNSAGQHAVVMTPIVNSSGMEPNSSNASAFPRLGDALDIIDDLYTHLYRDGFIPLVRANAHAAIPLRRGQGILAELFKDH
jgi:hypothetical protein